MNRFSMSIVASLFACFTASAFAHHEEPVQVASLQVKERLQSIEQINVTAEKEARDVTPESQAVADILAELEALEADENSAEE
jgi:hypothetical protein